MFVYDQFKLEVVSASLLSSLSHLQKVQQTFSLFINVQIIGPLHFTHYPSI